VPEISLNAYENEIDQLIEQARYLEALAHIRHILGQYPHYVGAYYLLGKLMLEVDLPGLATDMFRRALTGDPEHLMARIGLGLAHERANDLDASIWNLERALELDPSNNDISDELRRMFGRRDGAEPDYITQTQAGLARLYIRGARPGRAVIELRKLLDESSARPDLLTALAEAYWRDDQLVQASEISQEILDKMPYNCKANLLLGSLWVNSGQDEGWIYLNRAQEVDPANAMADTLFGVDSPLKFREVTLDRLTYDPDAIEVDQGSAWFRRLETASVTVGISEAPPEMTESEVRLVDITAGLESQIEIPDWLRELGAGDEDEGEDAGDLDWMAGAGQAAEQEAVEAYDGPPQAFTEVDADVELDELVTSEEEMPDWLQELTTQEMDLDLDESERAPDCCWNWSVKRRCPRRVAFLKSPPRHQRQCPLSRWRAPTG
jgi:tetratricopeptide (TPR) repeat protein